MCRPDLRVALGTVYPYDESRIRGGVEAVALSLAGAMAKRDDVELHVVSCNRNVRRSHTERRGPITFHWLATGMRLYGVRAATVDAWRVRRLYERLRPDIIHAQGCSEYALAAPIGIPLALTIHAVELFVPAMLRTAHFRGVVGIYRRWIGGWIIKQSVRRAQAVISIAGDYVPRVMGGILEGKPVYDIANPIADDIWAAVPEDQEVAGQVLCTGSIIERKNAVGLVQAFAQVVAQVPRARLELAGPISEPAYHRQIEAQISRLGLKESVVFLGQLDEAQLLKAHARCCVVALASVQETAPMAIAQAMAAGKPVVATRVGGIPWMLDDGVTGHIVDLGDVNGIADRLVELLRDEDGRKRMGRAAREAARQRFAAGCVAEQTVQAYRDLFCRKGA